VVPDRLPLGVLVKEQTYVDDRDPSSYRKVPRLAWKYSMDGSLLVGPDATETRVKAAP